MALAPAMKLQVESDRAAEERVAAPAGKHSVVVSVRVVSAHRANALRVRRAGVVIGEMIGLVVEVVGHWWAKVCHPNLLNN